MRLYSWNVNGYRAIVGKNFLDWLASCGGDVVCLQETKVRPEQLDENHLAEEHGYKAVFNPSKKRQGWSGTAVFSRTPCVSHSFGMPGEEYQGEGRLIHAEFEGFHLLNCYFPNGQRSQERLDFKLGYYDAFLAHAQELRKTKPVVACGDFNTAHTDKDLKNPDKNRDRSGFLDIERAWLDRFIAAGYLDTFRMFNDEPDRYTWWDYRFKARERNAGWRIDYFFVSDELREKVARAWIEDSVMGSDHCPIGLELSI